MYCVCHHCEDVLPIFSNQLHMNRFYCMLQILMHTNNVFEMESVDGIENRYDGNISLVFIAPLIYGVFCIICMSAVYTCKVHIPGVKGCFGIGDYIKMLQKTFTAKVFINIWACIHYTFIIYTDDDT